jgi:hypothetical protein
LEQGNTYPLKSAEERTSQDSKREQVSKGHLPTKESRGVDKLGC